MHAIHLHEIHVPKSHAAFYTAVGALGCFAFALLTFVVAWFSGGREVANQLGGQVTLGALLIGTVVSAVFAALANPKDWTAD